MQCSSVGWPKLADEKGLTRYERQADSSYLATIIYGDFLTRLKAQFLATPCPAYPLTKGFTGGLMGWMSYPKSSRSNTEKICIPAMCFGFYDVFILLMMRGKFIFTHLLRH